MKNPIKRALGFYVRREACRLAAQSMQGHVAEGDIAQRLWALSVFFENYMCDGAEGTRLDFGPKEPATFTVVRPEDSSAI